MWGQSTRPGHTIVDKNTEAERVLPVITALRKVSDVIISVDTFYPAVCDQALKAGANILNSVWGLNDNLLSVVKEKKTPTVIMHNVVEADKSSRKTEETYPKGVVSDVLTYLQNSALKAMAAGLEAEQIILDPGIGFAKDADDNLAVLSNLFKITCLGFPTLIGTSRKSVIGKLDRSPRRSKRLGTAATVAMAVAHGIDIVRVHDVESILDVVKVCDSIVRHWRPENWAESVKE